MANRIGMPTITQTQLESYLWGAAMLLRGLIDVSDYKQFIFPLLFFKRLCDVYDEETQQALDEAYAAKDRLKELLHNAGLIRPSH